MKRMKLLTALMLGTALIAGGCGNAKQSETAAQPEAPAKEEAPAAAEESAPAGEPEAAEAEAPKELSGELTYWSMWNDTEPQGEAWQEIIDGFMAKYPNVKVNVQWCGRDNKKI